ncbi:MAG TPA: ABC transporter substrate-binding protein [Stellaceae bacterium]|nr:ABC transporter substrate-binding protein [Stellaceae bacterium]
MKRIVVAALAAAVAVGGSPARAADHIKLGFEVGLSGPLAIIGAEMKRGLDLALELHHNKLGGVPVTTYVVDDKADPAEATRVSSKLIDEDKVDIVTGLMASNTDIAVEKSYLDAGIFVVGALAGPQQFAGKECHADAFHVSFENEDWDDAVAEYMNREGVKSVYFMGADYQAGWEKIGGAMRHYRGKAIGPVYTPLNQLDFSAELAQLSAANPQAVFVFYPGGLGIAFLKQFAEAGLQGKIAVYSEDAMANEFSFKAEGDAALGVIQAGSWSAELDNPANKEFVAAFEKKYGRRPVNFAALQYDAINLIDSAVAAVHGKIEDKAAFRAALRKADFQSVRGPFKFNNNQYPIVNIYFSKVVKDPDGNLRAALLGSPIENFQDLYHQQCPLK